jgi:hypothetical protein
MELVEVLSVSKACTTLLKCFAGAVSFVEVLSSVIFEASSRVLPIQSPAFQFCSSL